MMLILYITRIFTMAVRHGAESPLEQQELTDKIINAEVFNKRLLAQSWVRIPPKACMEEIQMAMRKVGAEDRYFNLRTLTPCSPIL